LSDNKGGKRSGSGRPKGSKNKMTIAREVVAEILDAPDPKKLSQAIHERGFTLLAEMERIALDPSQPVAARIMAAKTALPFMLPKKVEVSGWDVERKEELIRTLNEGRERVRLMRQQTQKSLAS